jgi:hypothetical protein
MLSPPPAVPSPAPGRASDAKRKRTWAAWTGLVLAAIATAGIGLGNWGMLATIQLDASPFSTAKWWLTGLLIVSVVPLVALVFCIVALVGKARRVVATIGLALSLVGPAVSGSVGADLGMKDLLRTVVAAGAAPGPDGRSGLLYQLESHGVDIPGWAEPFFEIGVEWLAPDG